MTNRKAATLLGWGVWLPETKRWLTSHDGAKLIAFTTHNAANRAAIDYANIFGPMQCEPRPIYSMEPAP